MLFRLTGALGSDSGSDPSSDPGSNPGSHPGSKFRYPHTLCCVMYGVMIEFCLCPKKKKQVKKVKSGMEKIQGSSQCFGKKKQSKFRD